MKSSMGNVLEFKHREQIKQEAGEWLVRLDGGDLSVLQLQQLQQWMAQSDFHRSYFHTLAKNWDDMAIMSELAELFPMPEEEKEQDKANRNDRRLLSSWFGRAVLAGVILMIGVFSLIQQYPSHKLEQTTLVGERRQITLEDGSVVNLNTNSRINIDYSGDRRIVNLQRGEASFEVAKNPNRPFVVYAGGGMVWAVGTAFNVRYLEKGVDVTVVEGTIKVYAEANQQPLSSQPKNEVPSSNRAEQKNIQTEVIATAGQSVNYHKVIQSHASSQPQVIDQKTAWLEGYLVFDGEPLEKVIAEIERYTDKELVIVDPQIRGIEVGGHFQMDDVDGLLDTLAEGFELELTRVSDKRILLSNGQ